jgi:D-sedoheptulose 7-phosphate isomerase
VPLYRRRRAGLEGSIIDLIQQKLAEGTAVLDAVAKDAMLHASILQAAEKTVSALKAGRKLLVAGNGGSAADAQHVVAEFVCRLSNDRPAMRAVGLTTNSSILTAVSNDYGFERIFARQIEALGEAGDVFMAISTSGDSPNVLRALETAQSMGVITIGLSGRTGGAMAALCDLCICVPSDVTMYIQQAHLALEHIFCAIVEQMYFAADELKQHGAGRQG